MLETRDSRMTFVQLPSGEGHVTLAEAVRRGLDGTPKSLPSMLFYDQRGSELFEQITALPEYYPTRTELSILRTNACEMVSALGDRLEIVEFGSGSSAKTRTLLESAMRLQGELTYIPIDISTEFLRATVESLLERYSSLRVHAIAGEYRDAFAALPDHADPLMAVFLGSNIGNFRPKDAVGFLSMVAERLGPDDRLLLGTDMVKDRAVLHAAYNDADGVTAEFNKNLLRRINDELGGEFDRGAFDHEALFVEEHSRIEMRLVSRYDQRVWVADLGQSWVFEQGERILTEYSHKYTPEGLAYLAAEAGLRVVDAWTDERAWFQLSLLAPRDA